MAAASVENQLAAAVKNAGFDVVQCGATGSAVFLDALGRHALVGCAQLEIPDVLALSDEVPAVHQVAIVIADVCPFRFRRLPSVPLGGSRRCCRRSMRTHRTAPPHTHSSTVRSSNPSIVCDRRSWTRGRSHPAYISLRLSTTWVIPK